MRNIVDLFLFHLSERHPVCLEPPAQLCTAFFQRRSPYSYLTRLLRVPLFIGSILRFIPLPRFISFASKNSAFFFSFFLFHPSCLFSWRTPLLLYPGFDKEQGFLSPARYISIEWPGTDPHNACHRYAWDRRGWWWWVAFGVGYVAAAAARGE